MIPTVMHFVNYTGGAGMSLDNVALAWHDPALDEMDAQGYQRLRKYLFQETAKADKSEVRT